MTPQTWLSARALFINGLLGLFGLMLIMSEVLGVVSFDRLLFPGHFKVVLSNILFLNTTHVVFTLILLRTSPEYSLRFKRVTQKFKWFLVFLAMLSTSVLALFITHTQLSVSAQLATLFVVLIPQFHVLAQHKGLCLNLIPHSPLRNRVKHLWTAAIIFLSVASIVTLYPTPRWLELSIVIASLFLFSTLIATSYWAMKTAKVGQWTPYLFHLKLLMFPFVFISPMASFLIISLHGIEYVGVVSSQVDYSVLMKDWTGLGGIALFTVFIASVTWLAACEFIWTPLGIWSYALLMSTVVLHYALDGVLFRSPKFYTI